jgi:uncharacterized protein YdaU (DUF1376 family)
MCVEHGAWGIEVERERRERREKREREGKEVAGRGKRTDDRRQKKRDSPVGAAFPDLSLSKVSRDLSTLTISTI